MKQTTKELLKEFEIKVNDLALQSNLLYNSLADETGNILNEDVDELFNQLNKMSLNEIYQALCNIDV